MITGLFNNGAMPALERVVQFTARRHKLIVHNIANMSTPHFEPKDVSPEEFQQALGRAVDRRREAHGSPRGELEMRSTRHIDFTRDSVNLRTEPSRDNILFHDRNNRSLEEEMKNLAANTSAHNRALKMLNNQFDMLQRAITGRL